jgi:hypothetical protein
VKKYKKFYKKKPGIRKKARKKAMIPWHCEKDRILHSNSEIIEYLEKMKKAEIVNE